VAGLWFKFWASNFITDGDIDALTDSASVLLIKMRCVCCIEGFCPASAPEIARKTRTAEATVYVALPSLLKFFEREGQTLRDIQQDRDAALTERGKRGARAANSKRRGGGNGDGGGGGTSDARPADTTSDAMSGGTSDAASNGGGARATSDATSGGTSDAQKLEVRSKKLDGSVDVVGSEKPYAVVGAVEAVEIVQNVPRGTLHAFPTMTDAEIDARKKQLQHQAQTLLKKGNSNTNFQPNGRVKNL